MAKGLITAKTSETGVKKYIVLKTENPTTKKQSTINTDFSSEHWNAPTLTLLANVKALGSDRFDKIFNEALAKAPPRRGRGLGFTNNMDPEDEELLQSESDSGDNNDVLMSDTPIAPGEDVDANEEQW